METVTGGSYGWPAFVQNWELNSAGHTDPTSSQLLSLTASRLIDRFPYECTLGLIIGHRNTSLLVFIS